MKKLSLLLTTIIVATFLVVAVEVFATGSFDVLLNSDSSITTKPGEDIEITVHISSDGDITSKSLGVIIELGDNVSYVENSGSWALDDLSLNIIDTKDEKICAACAYDITSNKSTSTATVNTRAFSDEDIFTFTVHVDEEIEYGTTLSDAIKVMVSYTNESDELVTSSGTRDVKIFAYGDLNLDDEINTTDVILLRRYIVGGYNITINEEAADVNKDGKINTADVILLRRYIAGGYGITFPVE